MAGALRGVYEDDMEHFAPHKALEEVFKVIQTGQQVYRRERPLGPGPG
jgi:hypothetical protein